jgi:hypothetical protein
VLPLVGIICWINRRSAAYRAAAFTFGVLRRGRPRHIGVRHVLPVYLAFSVIGALGLVQLARFSSRAAWAGPLAGVLVLWLVATGALHHPDYIPYFNELVQGPQPDRVLCDSDYDWGQDTKRLAARLKQLGATQVNYGYLNSYDNTFLETYPGLPRHRTSPLRSRRTVASSTQDRHTMARVPLSHLALVPISR